jgi:hypothetical protein
MKLFTIGDSISQGFMSGAAARTDLSYSNLIAKALKIPDYRYPTWGSEGLPVNLEWVMRSLSQQFGNDITLLKWPFALSAIGKLMDQVEDYYERGEGSADRLTPVPYFHNIAVQGFRLSDALWTTPNACYSEIAKVAGKEGGDNTFAFPSATFHRTALKVLNPSLNPAFNDYSQLDWLNHHTSQEGVENLLLWLGANNALATVMNFQIHQTPGQDAAAIEALPWEERLKLNLWHPVDFAREYADVLQRVDAAMAKNKNPDWSVFIGTVPLVTIVPFAKGVGPTTTVQVNSDYQTGKQSAVYYKYYTYFFREEDAIRKTGKGFLTISDAIYIDDVIKQYNLEIKRLVQTYNQKYPKPRYHIVDTSRALQEIAFKRNAGQVGYQFPDYFRNRYPGVNTKYYHADRQGTLRQGGLFSLDGIHPSAIGQGIIAQEFLKVMQQAGKVPPTTQLNWDQIFQSDRLYNQPINLMQELYENDRLAEFLVKQVTGK